MLIAYYHHKEPSGLGLTSSQGHWVIADHVNQGFNGIKNCVVGTKAVLETPNGNKEYTCIAKINGHNNGKILTDADGKSIENYYPGTLVAYTCNENYRNVTIVFFEALTNNKTSHPNVSENSNSSDNAGVYDCRNNNHCWGSWQIAWERYTNGKYYGWNKRICVICKDEDWVMRAEPSGQFKEEVIDKAETTPTEPTNSEDKFDIVPDETIETSPTETTEPTVPENDSEYIPEDTNPVENSEPINSEESLDEIDNSEP